MSLQDYGWSAFFSEAFESLQSPGLEPGRVLFFGGKSCRVATASGERLVSLGGRNRGRPGSAASLPVVGDWVAFRPDGTDRGLLEQLLPRRTLLSRKVPGQKTVEQIVAANIDIVLVVMGLDGDYSPRRLERYLTLAWESGARPAVILNKSDICPEAPARQGEIQALAADLPVLLLSSLTGSGIEEVGALIVPGETSVMVGSSGAGKSTLINRLLGREAQTTRPVREDDGRGRHTTTHRELFSLPGGGMLIDNPGIREVQLWAREESVAQTFEDVEGLAAGCHYRDCGHQKEPGCAVLEAVEKGTLAPDRLESWRALHKEVRHLETRVDGAARRERSKNRKSSHKEQRQSYKSRRK